MTATEQQTQRFIATLTSLGGNTGNQRLLEALGWPEDMYQQVKQQLVDAGQIRTGRGRGGSVALAAAMPPLPVQMPLAAPADPLPSDNTPPPAPSPAPLPELDYADKLWKAADKLRGNMEPSDYKHVALGLIFLKYISDTFEARHAQLLAEDAAFAEDKDEYLADNIFWVPKEARWSHLRAGARQPGIGSLIDDAMRAIERDNESLKGVLPKDYARPALNKVMLGELIDLISGIALNEKNDKSKDVFGRIYEYFLGQFASVEGKRSGEFYTPLPRSVARTLVEMLEPYHGRVYDPCCGSGDLFVQCTKFVAEHGERTGDIAIYGQESDYTTWRLARMNLAVHGIDSDIKWNNEGSLHNDALRDLKADFALAGPVFNASDWGGERLREDARWRFGAPPVGNANYAWLQHIAHHLAPHGFAGVVLANGSMSSQQSGEGDIRKAMVEAGVVDCMVALPGQLFYSTQIPACLWILAKDRSNGLVKNTRLRDRRGEVLFIDARNLGALVDRTRREFTDEEIGHIAATYHAWRGETLPTPLAGEGPGEGVAYQDIPGFCKAATLDEIRKHGHVLTPGRYVGAQAQEDDGEAFEEKMRRLSAQWRKQQQEAVRLDAAIEANLASLGFPQEVAEFQRFCDQTGERAEKTGLTGEKLKELLARED
ncbi:MAG: type I restriction-modification system subunit M [Burkholderiaceae bacterium]|nr:type I restriction-modification system subunit M [Burkholderiaceae bacterium]